MQGTSLVPTILALWVFPYRNLILGKVLDITWSRLDIVVDGVLQVGDLGRSSIEGKGVRIDVRRGLRFQSPEAICSGTTTKVSPHNQN